VLDGFSEEKETVSAFDLAPLPIPEKTGFLKQINLWLMAYDVEDRHHHDETIKRKPFCPRISDSGFPHIPGGDFIQMVRPDRSAYA
jgi:hypothetical protein